MCWVYQLESGVVIVMTWRLGDITFVYVFSGQVVGIPHGLSRYNFFSPTMVEDVISPSGVEVWSCALCAL